MVDFSFLQRGTFMENVGKIEMLTGCKGVVKLDDACFDNCIRMAISESYSRVMWNYTSYSIHRTGIKNFLGEELVLFAHIESANKIVELLRELSELGCRKFDSSFNEKGEERQCSLDFWWYTAPKQEKLLSDWMFFYEPQSEIFMEAISGDYNNWWMKMSLEEREEEYKSSLS